MSERHPLSATDADRSQWNVGDRFEVVKPWSMYFGLHGTVTSKGSTDLTIESLFVGVLDQDREGTEKHWYPDEVERIPADNT